MANSRNGSGHQRRCTPRRRFRLDIGELESRCVPSVYTVTTTANSGAGSFRQAILDANGNAGLDTIRFSINTGAKVITPAAGLPAITDPVQIDATTQPGYVGVPLIKLTGGSAGAGTSGLTVTAGGSTVAGLHFDHFGGNSLVLKTAGGNTIKSCYLGGANGGSGLRIESASNTIGGTTAASRNVISGNTGYGIDIIGVTASGNSVIGNYIGTQPNGASALANGLDGVRIEGGASGNTFTSNVISGNTSNGVVIVGNSSGGNVFKGNLIGANAAGTGAVSNGARGVYINGAPNNIIGGTTAADRNIISGSGAAGVRIVNLGATGNVVQGNYIGLNIGGAAAIPSGGGIGIGNAATNNIIGGSAPGAGNVISGTFGPGVSVDDFNPDTGTNTGVAGSNNSILGNIIGLNAAGTSAVPNASGGVQLTNGAKNNTVGTNIISGNGSNGVLLSGAGTSSNTLQGNFIGTNAAGTVAKGNALDGVRIDGGANGNTLTSNVISGNTSNGVIIFGNNSASNVLKGNFIGTNAAGTGAVQNLARGVYVDGAPNNIIGGTTAADRNIISATGGAAVRIANAGATGNLVQGNYVGLAADGNTAIPSLSGGGIAIGNAATFNTIGGTSPGAGNVISGGAALGVGVDDFNPDTSTNTGVGGSHNSIVGNIIGLNAAGTASVPNATIGVLLTNAAKNNTVGGNIISGNGSDGVVLSGAGTSGNTIQDNIIGLNIDGTVAKGNARHGVEIITGASGNTVGPGNTISANGLSGIYINGQTTNNNVVRGNFIGTNPTGTAAFGNGTQGRLTLDEQGIKVETAANNTIGGTAAGEGNVIAGNKGNGILLAAGTKGVVVQGNFIGTNASDAAGLGNTLDGIRIDASSNNTIGGSAAGAGNVIAGNGGNGVTLQDHVIGSTPFTPGTNNPGGLTLTAAGTALGFKLSTFIDKIPADSNRIGGLGMVFPRAGGFLTGGHLGYAYQFLNTTDNQPLSAFSKKTAYPATTGLTASGNFVYMSQDAPNPVITELNADGTKVRTVVNSLPASHNGRTQNPLGLVTNPVNGHLFLATGGGAEIFEIDPKTSPATVTRLTTNLTQPDGLTISPDGSTLYVADEHLTNDSQSRVIAFDVATKQIKASFPPTVVGYLDGITIGSGAMAGYLFVNTRDGKVVMISAADPSIQAVIASGGSRGDFATVDPGNDTVLLMQSDRIERLSLPAAGTTANNTVSGNMIGANLAGTAALPNGGDGVAVLAGAQDNTIGGTANVISGNLGNGVHVAGGASSGNAVRGNLIGATLSGLAVLPNGKNGVFLDGAKNNTVGGTTPADRNVISGNSSDGVLVANAGATGNVVAGNFVGFGTDGATLLPNGLVGVHVGSAANDNTIGGTDPGAGNLVGPNGGANVAGSKDGVAIDDWTGTGHAGTPGVGNAIRQNTIVENTNGVNGIRLAPGGNHDQAAPVISSAAGTASKLVVNGTLTSTANTTYFLELFASESGSPPQGQTYLGKVTVATNAGGLASFSTSLPFGLSPGQFVTATATNSGTNDTSAFSTAATVFLDTAPPTSAVDPLPPVTTTTSFPVSWSGGDNPGGSGLAFYDVWVSDNNGAFSLWQSQTTRTSATFTGQNGHQYGFFSIATDNIGNQQTPPSAPQATTTVNTDVPFSAVDSLPSYSPLTYGVHWSGTPGATGTAIAFYDIYVSDNGGAFSLWQSATTQTTAQHTGQDGHTYRFHSIATDTTGNVQPAPAQAQPVTRVDGAAPTSSVAPLPATANTSRLRLTWGGADDIGGSGLVSYDVYVSDNGGAFTQFRHNTTTTAADFFTRPGHIYNFHSLATDKVGNVQSTFTPVSTMIGGATAGAKFTFTDDDGDICTVALGGVGSMRFLPDDPDLNGKGPVGLLILQGTDPAKSKLTLTDKKAKTGDGRVSVGRVEGTGFLALTATVSDVIGDGVELTGPLGVLTVRDILNGAHITAAGTAAQTTVINARDIGNGTAISLGSTIAALVAARFGTGSITAPALGTLTIKGDAANKVNGINVPIPGDFGANLTLTGTGNPKKLTSLTKATIAGAVGASTWLVTGDAGTVSVTGAVSNWNLNVTGKLTTLALGPVTDAKVNAGGAVGSIRTRGWATGSLTAPMLGTLAVTGNFGGNVTLTGPAPGQKTSTLGSANVTGTVSGAKLSVAGIVGSFISSAFLNSSLYVGYTPTNSTDPMAGGSFAAGSRIGSFTVSGLKNVTTPAFGNSYLASGTIGTVTFKSVAKINQQIKYGVLADVAITKLLSMADAFRYDPRNPLPQNFGDFEVKVI